MFAHTPKKILFMASVGSHNLGDELIIKGEVEYIRELYGNDVEITVCTYDTHSTLISDDQVRLVSYFPNHLHERPFVNIGYFFQNLWLLMRSDVLFVGGGGILFDNEPGISFRWLFTQWLWRIRIARFFKTTLVFWGIGLEVTQAENKALLAKLFAPGDSILVRDTRSKGLLDALEIPSTEVQDIVFLYTPQILLDSVSPDRIVGISVRGGFLRENESVIPLIYDMIESIGYKPIFLVFSTSGEEDQNDILFIRRVMFGRTYNTTKNITQTLDMYPFLYAAIGMRLHAGILACVHDIPYIPISYGPKTDELIKMLEIDHLALWATDLNLQNFVTGWDRLIGSYAQEKKHMKEKHLFLKNAVIENLKNI